MQNVFSRHSDAAAIQPRQGMVSLSVIRFPCNTLPWLGYDQAIVKAA
jgi:hypothetical protein